MCQTVVAVLIRDDETMKATAALLGLTMLRYSAITMATTTRTVTMTATTNQLLLLLPRRQPPPLLNMDESRELLKLDTFGPLCI